MLRPLPLLAFALLGASPAVAQILDAKDADGTTRLKLDVLGGLLVTGTYTGGNNSFGPIPVEGAGTRMMWYPYRAAFRAGYTLGTGWDDGNIGDYSVAMGSDARARGSYSIALGNTAHASNQGSVAIGDNVYAGGANSVALGYYASTYASGTNGSVRQGTFVFGDRSTSSVVNAVANHSATWRTTGGFTIYTAANLSTGVSVAAGGTAWSTVSDSARKTGFRPYDAAAVLGGIAGLRLGTWHYRGQDPATQRHWGPMAQDFHAAFGHDGVGAIGNDTTISTQDADGVLFAAVQALEARTRAQEQEIAALRARLDALDGGTGRPRPVQAAVPVALAVVALAGVGAALARRRA